MATAVTAESVLDKISEGHLECPICSNRLREPKMLDCFHTFCLQCLQQLGQHQKSSSTKLVCPLCRHETILEGTNIAGLPSNFTLSALVEEVTMQEKLLEDQGSKMKCQNCDEKNAAISRCMDCEYFLCLECQRAHERMAVMKSHKIYTLAQLRSGEISYKSKLREHVPKCEKHPDQNLNIYCNTCKNIICTTCCVLDHGSPKHSLIGLPDASDKCKKQVAELVAKVEKSKTELSILISETDKSKKKLDSMFADTKRKISQKAQQEVAKIRQEERKLMREAEKIYMDRVKTFETANAINGKEVSQAENMLDKAQQLINQASCYEILDLEKKLLHNLSELTAKQPKRVPDRMSFIDFDEEGEGLLGRLTVDQPEAHAKESQKPVKFPLKNWELRTEMQDFGLLQTREPHYIRVNVASFSNGLIVVAKRRQVIAFSLPKSRSESPPVLIKLPIKPGLTEPGCVAVNRDDQLVILDKDKVKIFNKQHQLLHQFTPCEGSKNKLKCLAVDDNNLIAVGSKEKISLHNPDGSLIRTVFAPKISCYLTLYKQRLIYTHCGGNKLFCIDYHGNRVFATDIWIHLPEYGDPGDRFGTPSGVCCDSDGSIYVAMVVGPYGHILQYSPDGKLIGCAIGGCGPTRGITLTPAGDLVVLAGDSVQVYQHVTSK